MSNYIPNYESEIEFEGDTIRLEIAPLENDDFRKILPYFKEDDNGEIKLRFEDQEKFSTVSSEILKKYVVQFTGLKDHNGQPVDLDTVISKVYFIKLSGELFNQVFLASGISKEDEKKSDGPSEQASQE